MEITMRKVYSGLQPKYTHDHDEFDKLKPGTDYKVVVTRRNNPEFHNKLMGLLRTVFNNQDKYTVFEHLMEEFKIKTGFFTSWTTPDGDYRIKGSSISFNKMDHVEREEFFSRAIDVAINDFTVGLTGDELNKMIDEYLRFG